MQRKVTHHYTVLPKDHPLLIPEGAEIQVLAVTEKEGHGFGNRENHWQYILVR